MIEVRFHGRGGLGAVTASELLAHAAFLEGQYPQAFPFFGVERRGSPVAAYLRLDTKAVSVRTAITEPDIVVVLERSLLRAVPVTRGLKPAGLLLVNAPSPPPLAPEFTGRIAIVDATEIALRHGLGSAAVPIVNTAILGALVGATGIVRPESLRRAIEEGVPKQREENLAAAEEGHASVRLLVPRFEVPA